MLRRPAAACCLRRYEALSVPMPYEDFIAHKQAESRKWDAARARRLAAATEAAMNATADTCATPA